MAVRDIDNKTLDYIQNSLENHNVVFNIISARYEGLDKTSFTEESRGHLYLTIQLLSGKIEDIDELVICNFMSRKDGSEKKYRYNTILKTSTYQQVGKPEGRMYLFDFNMPHRRKKFEIYEDLTSTIRDYQEDLPFTVYRTINVTEKDLYAIPYAYEITAVGIQGTSVTVDSASISNNKLYATFTFNGQVQESSPTYNVNFFMDLWYDDFPSKFNHHGPIRIVRARKRVGFYTYNNSNSCALGITSYFRSGSRYNQMAFYFYNMN